MDNRALASTALMALADAIAAIAELQYDAATISELWTNVADESHCPPNQGAYTTLRVFGTVPVATQPNIVAVQAYTVGPTPIDAIQRAEAIHDALLDDQQEPRLGWSVAGHDGSGWLLDVFELDQPVLIANDGRGRSEVSMNFNLAYRRVA